MKTVKKTMTAKQTRKAPWKDLFLTLTKTGALDMRAMPNDPAPLLSLEIPYGVLLYDPGTERFSLAYRNETYHCEFSPVRFFDYGAVALSADSDDVSPLGSFLLWFN